MNTSVKILNRQVKRYISKKNWNVIRQKSTWILCIKIDPILEKYLALLAKFHLHFSKNIFMADYKAGREIWSKERREALYRRIKLDIGEEQ